MADGSDAEHRVVDATVRGW